MSEEPAATSDDWVRSLQEALRVDRAIEDEAATHGGAGSEPRPGPQSEPTPVSAPALAPAFDESALRAAVARGVESAMRAAASAQRPQPGTVGREVGQLEALLDRFSRQMEATVGRVSADAWDDMQVVTKELRSRVDDLEEQQKRALRELAEWRADLDERLAALPSEIVRKMERDASVEAPRSVRFGR